MSEASFFFAKTLIPSEFFADPAAVMTQLSGAHADLWLERKWANACAQTQGTRGEPPRRIAKSDDGSIVVFRVPQADEPNCAAFAATGQSPAGPLIAFYERCLDESMERLSDGECMLTTVSADGTRANRGPRPGVNEEACVREMSVLFAKELRLTATPTASPVTSVPAASPSSRPGPSVAPESSSPKRRRGRWTIALVVIAIIAMALAYVGYEPGLDPESTFDVVSTLSIGENGDEQVEFRLEVPDGVWRYEVDGPGASCEQHPSQVCTVNLGGVSALRPSYRFTAIGRGAHIFDNPIAEYDVLLYQTVEVERTPRLEYSSVHGATVIRGFPGRLEFRGGGYLSLEDAPEGAVLLAGSSTDPPSSSVRLGIPELINSVGLRPVFGDEARVSVPDVVVRLTDGTEARGTVEFPASHLRSALLGLFAAPLDAALGPAEGDATIWLSEGNIMELVGSAQRIADVGQVILTNFVEEDGRTCGPYIGAIPPDIPRTRWTATVEVYDRVRGVRSAQRRFEGDIPSCPETLPHGTPRIHGERSTVQRQARTFAESHIQR